MLIRRRSGPSHALTHSHAQPTKANQSGGTLTVLRWLDKEVGVLAEIAVDSPDIIDADRSPAIPSYARIVEHAGRKRRERTVEFELPKIQSVADVLKTSSAVISACAAGELSPREASEIMELISSRVRDVYLDGIVLKRTWAGEIRNVSLRVAISVNGEGYREILGICEGAKEDKAGWSAFLKHLKERGLAGLPEPQKILKRNGNYSHATQTAF